MSELTKEQLEQLDKDALIQQFMNLQEQYKQMDQKQQLILEQLAVMNRRQYGKSSEKLPPDGQLMFVEPNGEIGYFNEAEAVAAATEFDEEEPVKRRGKKVQGKRAADISNLPVVQIDHMMTEDELVTEFGEDGWRQLPDEIYNRYRFVPAKVEIEEHHVGVYKSRTDGHFRKAPHPAYLIRNSLVSPTLEAAIMNAKYVNAMPLYRQEQDFARYGMDITRAEMAHWTILCAERYLSILYDFLHRQMYGYHVLQADETSVRVHHEDRTEGDKHYMWVYRTGRMYSNQIVLYDYQPTRNASHPAEFLKDFRGICVTDGYQVYHRLEAEHENLKIAGCWAHARRRFDDALKAQPKENRKSSLAHKALKLIQAVYREEGRLKDLPPDERLEHRQLMVKPLVDAYFAWVKQNVGKVLPKSETGKGFSYSLNQEKYLRVFLTDGEVPMDNNSAEQSIRGFCVGRKNWVAIDTIAGAQSSAIIYSITETAKANNLKPYNYLEYLLTVIPEHMDDHDTSFCEDLLPWSDQLPDDCRKPQKS